MNEYTIILTWDDEASVWIAESEDIPGLILESDSFDTLIERVKLAIPDLLEYNGKNHLHTKLHFKAERLAVVADLPSVGVREEIIYPPLSVANA